MHILWTGIPNDAKNLINAKFLSRLRRLLEWQQVLCNYLENAEDDLDLIIRSTFFRVDLLPQPLTIPLMATSVENSSGPWFSFNFISPVSNDLVLFRHVRAFFYRSKGRRPWGNSAEFCCIDDTLHVLYYSLLTLWLLYPATDAIALLITTCKSMCLLAFKLLLKMS